MSTIQSLGIGSGLQIGDIVGALVDAERVPREQALSSKEDIVNAKLSAYGEMKSRLAAFQSSVAALRLSSNFNQKNATSSDTSAFTATANSIAENTAYSVQIDSLAQAQSLATPAFSSVDEILGTGTITVRFGTTSFDSGYSFEQDTSAEEKTITVDSSNNTVASLKDHINNNDYGFKASIINDGNGFRLVFTAESGASNSLQLSITDDGDGLQTNNGGLSQLTMDNNAQYLTQNVEAKDAKLFLNGIEIISETNTISNAINGVTLNLASTTTTAKTLTISSETSQFKEQVTRLVDSYNEFITYTSELTAFSSQTGEGSLLLGDATVRTVVSQIRATMFSQVSGVDSGLQALSNIGILSTQSNGSLEFNEEKFNQALNNSSDEFQSLFSTSGRTTDPLIQFVSGTSFTKEGRYNISITQLASKGNFLGNPVLPDFGMGPLNITADNDEFEIRVDGYNSGVLSIPINSYATGEEFANTLQELINNASPIASRGLGVTVTYDNTSNSLAFESSHYGSSSGIGFVSVDTTSASTIGIFQGSGNNGMDVAGSVTLPGNSSPIVGSGNGQFLSFNSGDAQGLKIGVLGGAADPSGEPRGSVTFSRGIADKLNNLLDSLLEPNSGFIDTRINGLDITLEQIELERTDLNFDMERLEARLLAQYNAIDALVGQLNNLSTFLTSALSTLPGAQKPKNS